MIRALIFVAVTIPNMSIGQTGESLPAYLLRLPASVTTVLVAETEAATLHRYGHAQGVFDAHDTRYMSIGQNGVGKERAWDRKTPLGIYFIEERLDTKYLHEKYGPIAFPLDYPNVWDRINDRAGDGIWLHGVAANNERRPPQDTDGCIALPNDDLLELTELLEPAATPVIITRRIDWVSRNEVNAMRQELETSLDKWVQSYQSGDLYQHVSLYAEDFEFRGMNRSEWIAYRTQTIASRPIGSFSIDDVFLLADPEEEGLYLSRFRQTVVRNARSTVTIKRLYWKRSINGALRIAAEDNG